MNTIQCIYCGEAFGKGYALSRHERSCFDKLPPYEKGYIDGVRTFAVWDDGVEKVGVSRMPFKKYVAEWLNERRRNER